LIQKNLTLRGRAEAECGNRYGADRNEPRRKKSLNDYCAKELDRLNFLSGI